MKDAIETTTLEWFQLGWRECCLRFVIILLSLVTFVTAPQMNFKPVWQKSATTVMTGYQGFQVIGVESLLIVLFDVPIISRVFRKSYHHLLYRIKCQVQLTSSKFFGGSGKGLRFLKGFLLSSMSHFCLHDFK